MHKFHFHEFGPRNKNGVRAAKINTRTDKCTLTLRNAGGIACR